MQKKETRRKGINGYQLAIRNVNDIAGKHIKTVCIFFFFFIILRGFV